MFFIQALLDPAVQSMIVGTDMIVRGSKSGFRAYCSNNAGSIKIMNVFQSFIQSAMGAYFVFIGVNLKFQHNPLDFVYKRGTVDRSQEHKYEVLSKVDKSNKACCVLARSSFDYKPLPTESDHVLQRIRFLNYCGGLNVITTDSLEELCSKIQASSCPIGRLFITAPGSQNSIDLMNEKITASTSFTPNCFSRLTPDAHVYLWVSSAGQNLKRGIAAHFAASCNRTVTAPDAKIKSTNIYVGNINNLQDPTRGVRFTSTFDIVRPGATPDPTHLLDHTVVCTQKGDCTLYQATAKGIMLSLTYSFINNTFVINVMGIKCVSLVSSFFAACLNNGIEVVSPYVKSASYALLPNRKPLVDQVGRWTYSLSKTPVYLFRTMESYSPLIDRVTCFGLRIIFKTLGITGKYMGKGVEILANAIPSSNNPLINLTNKVTKTVLKASFGLLHWTGDKLAALF